ncbi:MAG TPA: alcohol dehydrogenase catalytic domain-containing protein [Anaerolineales bacterium]|nr:alcohol dehydrogenase catalytic domain-containing protein [Anaerolineales bacterium]
MRSIYFDKDIPRLLLVKALRRAWPGVVWSALSPTRYVDLPESPLPGPKWLRVRNRQCGICATDLSLLQVKAHPSIAPAAVPGIQRIYLGHEAVGEVMEVGPEVRRFKVGDRVVMEARPFGSPNCHTQAVEPPCRFCAEGQNRLCENASLGLGPLGVGGGWGDGYTAHESEVWPIPADLDDDQASLIEPSACAVHGVLRRPPRAGENVLVVGCGVIGLLAIQALRWIAPGCRITALARYEHQADAARRLGADDVIRETDPYAELARITSAKLYRAPLNRGMLLGGFEVIYDCVGSPQTVFDSVRWARAGGAVVLIGLLLDLRAIDLSPIYYQEVDLIGSNTFGMENWQGRRLHTFDLVIERMRDGAWGHAGLITHRFPLHEYRRAVRAAADKRSGAIKVTFEL